MFKTIFTFEIKRWLKSPLLYIYIAIFFVISLLIMGSSLGIFDSFSSTTSSRALANSPIAINQMLNSLSVFIYFLLPSIVGASVYRDFKYNMHSILFSYPFRKWDYLMGKFLSSFSIVILITVFIGIAAFLASFLPGVNPNLLGEHSFTAYIQTYLIFIIPNLFTYGVIVFAVVTIFRNISIGFITVLILFFLQEIVSNFTQNVDNKFLVALFEPFGSDALKYYTKYWTVFEKNNNVLPFKGVLIYNRILWLSISVLILGFIYKYFSFTQNALTFRKSKSSDRMVKNNFGGITKINLTKVTYDYSILQKLKTTWSLAKVDFKFIVKNWIFISILLVGMIFILLMAVSSGEFYGTETYPTTWQMLAVPGNIFGLFINMLTFLFTGLLIHRGATTRMNHLVDVTPTPNWVLLLSKFIAIVKMQIVLLAVIMISGILFQMYKGYFNFEIGHYLKELYTISLIHYVIWAFLAIVIQSLFKNYLLGFFVLLMLSIGLNYLSVMGIEQDVFQFNSDTGYRYSDMNGYGHTLGLYFVYKLYWLLLGIVFFFLGLLFFKRGMGKPAKERIKEAFSRLNKRTAIPLTLSFLGFIALGSTIYYQDNIVNTYKSSNDAEKERVEWEKKYKKYENRLQPRITDVKIDLDIFPDERNYNVNGTYVLKNKTNSAIDTIFINRSEEAKIDFNVAYKVVSKDTVFNFDIYKLDKPLLAGDSITMTFAIKNKPNTLFKDNSPIINNGTFINNGAFPSIGYSDGGEISDDEIREKYGLKPKERMASPTDSIARKNTYISSDSDWITFETTISTSNDQTAIAPGYLTKKWEKDGRNFFHYKMDKKMLNFYAFQSAKYEVKKDKWNDVNIEIYYHKGHEYNLDRMIKGVKKSLDYYTENFSPYQHKQVRIIEFPRTGGGFAQSFANTIPFSESIGFIAAVDDEDEKSVDYPFSVTAHEVAHQWWAHQVIGANVQGATLLSESLSEYSSLMVLEKEYGKSQMRKFLKESLDTYLTGRSFENKKEKPLMYNENQQYIHYYKGSMVLYALSDYIGEKNMNNALKKYVSKVAFQEAPYTNSLEMVKELRDVTPDSLQYVINDMFETITLYENRVKSATYKKLPNGKYQVDMELEVVKYKADDLGERVYKDKSGKTLKHKGKDDKYETESYPLADYIDVGVFSKVEKNGKKTDKELYLKKHKITEINNKITVIVDEVPSQVGIDPLNKLIDVNSNDNRIDL
ncbi:MULTISPECIES: ABC transporter permease/M1 family aminopeptidase [Flavobacterium]|uniref:ABC transporter permease/M1 family aminopeptidase n=1 Tax=Flavobacterium jumunjinense TaxID=998845 RepID=A0ABV5GKJ9_9FLAO|nr:MULTISPECIES: M1 family aminopeptidase [Flavobacterium]